MQFQAFCETLAVLEATASRTALMERIADWLAELAKQSPTELRQSMYMLQGRVVPHYVGLEFNYSNKSFINSIDNLAAKLGLEYNAKQVFTVKGDAGELAADFITQVRAGRLALRAQTSGLFTTPAKLQEAEPVEITVVYELMLRLANTTGAGAVKQKSELTQNFLLASSPLMAKYFAKIITGSLRLGVSSKTILDAISFAKVGDKSLRKVLDRAYGLQADLGTLAELVLVKDADLSKLQIALGIPLAAQLVEREKDAEAIVKRMPKVIIQAKYDGLRAQLHYAKKGINVANYPQGEAPTVQIYSRNQESLTEMFPDLVAIFTKQQHIDSLILDGEVIGYDETTASFLPFQETIQRKRKYDVEATAAAIPIRYFIFDLLYLNGQDLTEQPLGERLKLLRELNLVDPDHKLQITESPEFTDPQALDSHFRKLLDQGLEGIIAKDPNSPYSPGKRGFDWIKLKANTFADLKDSVDTVVMGYYHGRGQRARFGIGGFLVGVYNPELDCFQSIAKVGSGVKDEEWGRFKVQLDAIHVPRLPENYQIRKQMLPDIIVRPEIVAEVDADEITLSKNHTAGLNKLLTSPNSEPDLAGFSLRFPRIKLFDRDKGAEQTTTVDELKRLYELGKKEES